MHPTERPHAAISLNDYDGLPDRENTGKRATIMMLSRSHPNALGYAGLSLPLFLARNDNTPEVQHSGLSGEGMCEGFQPMLPTPTAVIPRALSPAAIQWLVPIRAWAARLTKFA